jgi:hypothetical protein
VKNLLRRIKQEVYHRLKLYPVYEVIKEINRHYPLKNCSALEAFAYTGAWQTRAYKHLPAYIEAWEIDPECREPLHKNLPGATIRITDSFEEVKRCNKKFDFINVDTHQGIFGKYCENFEFFPLLFNVAADECIVNLNMIPFASGKWRKKYPDLFNHEHLKRRQEFYKVSDGENIPIDVMLKRYKEIAAGENYEIIWHYIKQRTLTWYLVLHLKKIK